MLNLKWGTNQPAAGGQLNVLIVDDNLGFMRMVERYLVMKGAQVTTAGDGRQGWEIFLENPNAFDVALVDIQMPVMSGVELLTRIRECSREAGRLPVIAMSGACICDDHDFDSVLRKPFDFERLLSAIKGVLSGEDRHDLMIMGE